ncbi:MAG: hypothetical protein MHPSP_003070, partial [Paramarteilia canceri]
MKDSSSLKYSVLIDGITKDSVLAKKIEKDTIHFTTNRVLTIYVNQNEIVDFEIIDERLFPVTKDFSKADFYYNVDFIETEKVRNHPIEA